MKKMSCVVLIVFAVSLAIPYLVLSNEFDAPPGDNWIYIGEEQLLLNDASKAVLIKRMFFDANQKNGLGAALYLRKKGKTDFLFWKGSNLYTPNGSYAILFGEKFYVQPTKGLLSENMITLKSMYDYLITHRYNVGSVATLMFCLRDKYENTLVDKKLGKVCHTLNLLAD